jgi:hypothetical protein
MVVDVDGNQLEDAEYDGNRVSAAYTMASLIKKNGGAIE